MFFGKRSLLGFAMMMAVAAFAVGETEEASAQTVCRYGPSNYRRCCTDSYRESPGLGARARAKDIDACMDDRRRPSDVTRQKTTEPDKATDAAPASTRGAQESSPVIRRLECASGKCEAGCATNEMAISAFCSPGGSPTMYGDGSIRCVNGADVAFPAVLFCARK